MPVQPENFGCWLESLAANASQRRGRYLLVLSGAREWSLGWCLANPVLDTPGTLWISTANVEHRWQQSPGTALSLLGSETSNIVYDAWSGLHPNGFGAVAGTLRAGGLMVLLAPELDAWPHYADPDYRRMRVEGFTDPPERLFLQHLGQTLRRDGHAIIVRQGAALPPLPTTEPAPAEPFADSTCRTSDQLQAVEAIEQVVRGHRCRPLVLRSDRGRGKSAALGIAAARLLQAELDTILLTAPLASNVTAVLQHAADLLEGCRRQGNTLVWRDRRLQYVPPDELLRTIPPARLLLVDEAAGIPLPLLSRILDHYRRVVFTTTVHGYEGTGQGFAIRFSRELERRRPQWRSLVLQQPIRWAENDPLEASVNAMLLLGAEPSPPGDLESVMIDQLEIEWLDRRQLVQLPELLSQLVGLLVNAHYRTSPDDVRILLDGPNIRLLVARSGTRVAGVVMVAQEGNLPVGLVGSIRQGRRRPRGHLLPQALWAHSGNAELLARSVWRVVRIAVHPALQRRGLGQRMLRKLRQSALQQGVNYLGSSFACSSELVRFWQRADYTPVALGVRRDASSGSHALMVLQGLAAGEQDSVARERKRFADTFAAALGASLQQLEPDIVGVLLPALEPAPHSLQPRDHTDLSDFTHGARTYEHCQFALRRAALNILADANAVNSLSDLQRKVLVTRVLQQHSVATVAQGLQLPGKSAVLECLRTAFTAYYSAGC